MPVFLVADRTKMADLPLFNKAELEMRSTLVTIRYTESDYVLDCNVTVRFSTCSSRDFNSFTGQIQQTTDGQNQSLNPASCTHAQGNYMYTCWTTNTLDTRVLVNYLTER